jgi:hypothetical protein
LDEIGKNAWFLGNNGKNPGRNSYFLDILEWGFFFEMLDTIAAFMLESSWSFVHRG